MSETCAACGCPTHERWCEAHACKDGRPAPATCSGCSHPPHRGGPCRKDRGWGFDGQICGCRVDGPPQPAPPPAPACESCGQPPECHSYLTGHPFATSRPSPATAGRMEEERFEELAEIIEQRHRDKTENWVLAEARRARESEAVWEAEAKADRARFKARGAELDAKDAEIASLTRRLESIVSLRERLVAKDAEIANAHGVAQACEARAEQAEAHAKRETLRADHAQLIADMYKAETEKAEADLVALKAENTRLREIGKEYLICGVESANKHYELVQVPRSLIADARAALGGGE